MIFNTLRQFLFLFTIRVGLFVLFLGYFSCSSKEESKSEEATLAIVREGMVYIPAMEENGRQIIAAFWMNETEVTNAQFAVFVEETGYETIAERPVDWEELSRDLPSNTPRPPDSLLQAGSLVFYPTKGSVPLNRPELWWRFTRGVNWKHPNGPEDNLEGKENHPVVHVAWEDAQEYAKWTGMRLPSEKEWEWAARGGEKYAVYPWGAEDINIGKSKANYWQGSFPHQNDLKDGHALTAPVKSFPPNNYGLYDMAGNVWEWCAGWAENGHSQQEHTMSNEVVPPTNQQKEKIIKGGSFLCSDTYCSGYIISNRMSSTIDTGLNHTGFRCVKSTSVKD